MVYALRDEVQELKQVSVSSGENSLLIAFVLIVKLSLCYERSSSSFYNQCCCEIVPHNPAPQFDHKLLLPGRTTRR